MALVGPGAIVENEISPKPILEGLGADYIVTVLNPLSDDFAIQVGQSKPIDLPVSIKDPITKGQTSLSESDINRMYGIGVKNPDHASRKHYTQQVIIKAGTTMKLTGDVAQVGVRQIVNELMQRENAEAKQSDPTQRRLAEQRVIVSVQSQYEFMNNPVTTVDQQVKEALDKANEANNDKAFPGFSESTGSETASPENRTSTTTKDDGRAKEAGK